jgi:RNA recognition motif-containing protein
MDRPTARRRVPNRPRTGPLNKPGTSMRRRQRLITRRNRRFVPRRNRLARAQNNQNRNGRLRNRRFRRFNNFNRRPNFQRRIIFVGGLPNRITNRALLQLFRREGRIINYRVMRNRAGFSRGFGFVEFARPRDAWRSIQKWNNTTLDRNIIKVQFRRRRRNFNQRRFGNNNFNNRNNGRFNQPRRGFGFRGGRGGFRPRGGF